LEKIKFRVGENSLSYRPDGEKSYASGFLKSGIWTCRVWRKV